MKVIEDILKEVDQEVLRKAPHAQRKYNKITESLRVKFLNKIFQENKSIKKAAEELNINYSSAKTILTMHRKKSKSGNSPSDEMNNGASHIDFTGASSSTMTRTLPPKHLIKQSFMSTASNLSEQKDYEDSCSDHHDEMKALTHSNPIKKSFIQNRNLVLVAPQNNTINQVQQQQQNNLSNLLASPQQQQNILQTPIQSQMQCPSQMTTLPQNLLLQIQQQMQAQQQQQQQQQNIQNTIQQLLLIQNALLSQQQQQQTIQQQPIQNNNSTLNPLAQLLLQQQLMNTAGQQKFF